MDMHDVTNFEIQAKYEPSNTRQIGSIWFNFTIKCHFVKNH